LSGAPGLLSLNSHKYSAISFSCYLIKALSFLILAFSSFVNVLVTIAVGFGFGLLPVITFYSSLTALP